MITIEQAPGATTTLTASSSGFVNSIAVPTLASDATAATPSSFYDSETLEVTGAEAWNQYEISSELGNSYTFENLSVCQTLTGNSVAPVGDGGTGRIRVTNGSVSKILKCDTTKSGGQTYSEFVQYAAGTIPRYLYDQISAIFDATPDTSYYSAYNHAAATYTRNPLCWAASIDLSCVAVANNATGEWARQRGGTLITSRHILIAAHFPCGVGTQVRFSNAAGTVQTATVIGSAASGVGDMWVCTLSAVITVANPCEIVGEWISQDPEYAYGNTYSYYAGGLVIHMTQNALVYAATLGFTTTKVQQPYDAESVGGTSFPSASLYNWIDHGRGAIPAIYDAMRYTPIPGDSGQPAFVIIDGQPVLLGAAQGPETRSAVQNANGAVLNALIAAADTNAGISTGYTVTIAPDPTA